MKFKPDKKYIQMGIIAFIVAVCTILFVFAVFNYPIFATGFENFIKVLRPVINGFLVAYLLNPVMKFFETRFLPALFRALKLKEPEGIKSKRIFRYISIALTVIFVFLFIGSFIGLMIPQLVESITSIAHQFPEYADNLVSFVNKTFDDNPRFIEYFNQFYSQFEESFSDFLTDVPTYLNQIWSTLSSGIAKSVAFVLNLALGLILSIYILSFKEKFIAQIRKITLAYFSRKRAHSIFEEIRNVDRIFKDYIVSSIVDSLIIGILCFILCLIIGTPYAILMSFIVGITNIIPFFGPFFGAVPCTIIILMINPMQALYFVIMIVCLQQLDGNVIKPRIFGESTGLPAFWVVVSILVGGGFFGVMGMYLGTPVFAVIYSDIRRHIAYKLSVKGLPGETSKYLFENELPYEVPKAKKTANAASDNTTDDHNYSEPSGF